MTTTSTTTGPATDDAAQASFSQRVLRRGRFGAAVLRDHRLRGVPMALGPRVKLDLGSEGTFERGPRCAIGGDFHGHFHGRVRWGSDVYFNVGCYVSALEELSIGDRCRFGERVSIHDEDHLFEPRGVDRGRYRTSPVIIGDDVWVGAGSIVLRGTRIGDGAVVAAGSVVRGEVPPHTLVAGAPARVIRPLRG